MNAAFLRDRITATKARIILYEEALSALGAAGGVQSYKLDTGQNVVSVTRADIKDLESVLEGLYNTLVVLEARLTGNGVTIGKPAW